MASLVPKCASELSDSVLAVFGLQDEQLMQAVSEHARPRLVSEQINHDIKASEEVADNMGSMSSGLQGQLFDSEHELHFGGVRAASRRSSVCR